jgi:hypothetical protein
VVYCKAPFAGPEQVLCYLSRYSHCVAISNRRLISIGDDGSIPLETIERTAWRAGSQ